MARADGRRVVCALDLAAPGAPALDGTGPDAAALDVADADRDGPAQPRVLLEDAYLPGADEVYGAARALIP